METQRRAAAPDRTTLRRATWSSAGFEKLRPVSPAAPGDPYAAFGGTRRAYVVVPLKILFISTSKNACTSLKWLIAELAGEDLSRFRPGLEPFVSDDEAIHRRRLFQHTPKLNQIPVDVRRSIRPDDGWFVFGVTRDQRARLFSAWENKYLMRHPAYRRWLHEPWFPPIPESAEDIVESFGRFVELITTDPGHPAANDAHFMSQTWALKPAVVPYSRIYDISELNSAFISDITAHLHKQGWNGAVQLRQTNDTPLRANRHVFREPILTRIERRFADDFENFGHTWDFGRIEAAKDWEPDELGELRVRIALNERIADLLAAARKANQASPPQRATDRWHRRMLQLRAHPRLAPARSVWRATRARLKHLVGAHR
jgi:hypothetical protein